MRRILSAISAILILCSSVLAFAIESEVEFVGIWKVEALGTETPVYDITKHVRVKDSQEIVDMKNTAYIKDYNLGVCRIICDHLNSQVTGGLWDVSKITVDSKAWLITKDGYEEYVCYMVCKAKNYPTYYKVNGIILNPSEETEIWCSCCSKDGNSWHYVAMFKKVE